MWVNGDEGQSKIQTKQRAEIWFFQVLECQVESQVNSILSRLDCPRGRLLRIQQGRWAQLEVLKRQMLKAIHSLLAQSSWSGL